MHFGYNNPNNIFLLGGHILETVDEKKRKGFGCNDSERRRLLVNVLK